MEVVSHFFHNFPILDDLMMLKLKHSRVLHLHLFLTHCSRELMDPKIINQRTAPRFWSCRGFGQNNSRFKTVLQALTLPHDGEKGAACQMDRQHERPGPASGGVFYDLVSIVRVP